MHRHKNDYQFCGDNAAECTLLQTFLVDGLKDSPQLRFKILLLIFMLLPIKVIIATINSKLLVA